MNPGGIKVGSAEIETIINGVDGIAESAVIAVPENGTGPDQLVAFIVPSCPIDEELDYCRNQRCDSVSTESVDPCVEDSCQGKSAANRVEQDHAT